MDLLMELQALADEIKAEPTFTAEGLAKHLPPNGVPVNNEDYTAGFNCQRLVFKQHLDSLIRKATEAMGQYSKNKNL